MRSEGIITNLSVPRLTGSSRGSIRLCCKVRVVGEPCALDEARFADCLGSSCSALSRQPSSSKVTLRLWGTPSRKRSKASDRRAFNWPTAQSGSAGNSVRVQKSSRVRRQSASDRKNDSNRPKFFASLNVLQDVHICTFGPNRRRHRHRVPPPNALSDRHRHPGAVHPRSGRSVVRKLVPQCVCNSGYLCGGLVYDPVAFNAGSEVNWNV